MYKHIIHYEYKHIINLAFEGFKYICACLKISFTNFLFPFGVAVLHSSSKFSKLRKMLSMPLAHFLDMKQKLRKIESIFS